MFKQDSIHGWSQEEARAAKAPPTSENSNPQLDGKETIFSEIFGINSTTKAVF